MLLLNIPLLVVLGCQVGIVEAENCGFKNGTHVLQLTGDKATCDYLKISTTDGRGTELGAVPIREIDTETFNNMPAITEIVLQLTMLTSIAPNAFQGAPNLEKLRFDEGNYGILPGGIFTGLPKLKFLAMEHNNLLGLSDDAFIGMPALTFLELDRQDMIDINPVAVNQLSNLEYWDYKRNEVKGFPTSPILDLPKLTFLNFWQNSLTGLPDSTVFNKMPLLRDLILSKSQMTGFALGVFESLASLTYLNLTNVHPNCCQIGGLGTVDFSILDGSTYSCNDGAISGSTQPFVDADCPCAGTTFPFYCEGPLCSEGLYEENNACINCPAGSKCSNDLKEPCSVGLYSLASATSCDPCPQGSTCDNGIKLVCTGTLWSDGGTQTSCSNCPAGSQCNNGIKEQCAIGDYSMADSSTCDVCPPGATCENGIKINCAGTSWSDGGTQTSCSNCPAGSECNNGIKMQCTAGDYSAADSSTCELCPQGSTCENGVKIDCTGASWSDGGTQTGCLNCPAGSECNNGIKTQCENGDYSVADSSTCDLCPKGSTCENGIKVDCTGTSWSDGGPQTSCLNCPAGSKCNDGIKEQCPIGGYSVADASSCDACPLGSACNDGIKIDCSDTLWSDGGTQTSCSSCPAGSQCNNGIKEQCSIGEYSLADSGTCDVCPPGSACENGIKIDCAGTSWSDGGVQTSCSNCPAGSECNNGIKMQCTTGDYSSADSSTCELCPQGSTCENGVKIDCAGASWSDGGTQTSCLNCPAGSECNNGIKTQCENGDYSVADSSTCDLCPKGSTCENGIKVDCTGTSWSDGGPQTSCLNCPAGSKCNDGMKEQCQIGGYSVADASSCDPCPLGSACDNGVKIECTGTLWSSGGSQPNCLNCPAGSQCNNGIKVVCAIGNYSAADSSTCDLCPRGSTCENGIKTNCAGTSWSNGGSQTICLDCPAGSQCVDGIKDECQIGSYSFENSSTCDTCPLGSACQNGLKTDCTGTLWSDGGIQTSCLECPAGSECINGVKDGCPIGTYSPVNLGPCQPCPLGSACENGIKRDCTGTTWSDGGNQLSCLDCSAGSKCNLGIKEQCEIGYYSLADSGSCDLCPAGSTCENGIKVDCTGSSWSDGGPQINCLDCPAGSKCTKGIKKQCATGDYSSVHSTTCNVCPLGSICANGIKVDCTGTLWSDGGIQTICHNCPSGSKCVNGIKDDCQSGTYALENSESCIACPLGSACENGIKVDCTGTLWSDGGLQIACLECPAGSSCVDGIKDGCPIGTYSLETSGLCSICPLGSVCNKGMRTDCIGTSWSDGGAQIVCLNCPAGSKCINGIKEPCLNGFYSLPDSNICNPCPLGSACDFGIKTDCTGMLWSAGGLQTNCFDCPIGSICEDGIKYACPNGTYSSFDFVTCDRCPLGSACENGIKTDCIGTSWSLGGTQTACQNCTVGSQCIGGVKLPCSIGTYSPENSKTCYACPLGSVCNNGIETKCMGTLWSSGGSQTSCLNCPAGSKCVDGMKSKCPTGTYSLTNSDLCIVCPLGSTCEHGIKLDCTGTSWSAGGSQISCLDCQIGHYCLAGIANSCSTLDISKQGHCYDSSSVYDCTGALTNITCTACETTHWLDDSHFCQEKLKCTGGCSNGGTCNERSGTCECPLSNFGDRCEFCNQNSPLCQNYNPFGQCAVNSNFLSCDSCNLGYYANEVGDCIALPKGCSLGYGEECHKCFFEQAYFVDGECRCFSNACDVVKECDEPRNCITRNDVQNCYINENNGIPYKPCHTCENDFYVNHEWACQECGNVNEITAQCLAENLGDCTPQGYECKSCGCTAGSFNTNTSSICQSCYLAANCRDESSLNRCSCDGNVLECVLTRDGKGCKHGYFNTPDDLRCRPYEMFNDIGHCEDILYIHYNRNDELEILCLKGKCYRDYENHKNAFYGICERSAPCKNYNPCSEGGDFESECVVLGKDNYDCLCSNVYDFDGKLCTKCDSLYQDNCALCSSTNGCSTCKKGYANISSNCSAVCKMYGCEEAICSGENSVVPSCKLCSAGYFPKLLEKGLTQCLKCKEGCDRCTEYKSCEQCSADLLWDKIESQCATQCSQGLFPDYANSRCHDCFYMCQSCTAGTAFNCTKCRNEYEGDSVILSDDGLCQLVNAQSETNSSVTSTVIGSLVGGFILLVLLAISVFFVLRYKQRMDDQRNLPVLPEGLSPLDFVLGRKPSTGRSSTGTVGSIFQHSDSLQGSPVSSRNIWLNRSSSTGVLDVSGLSPTLKFPKGVARTRDYRYDSDDDLNFGSSNGLFDFKVLYKSNSFDGYLSTANNQNQSNEDPELGASHTMQDITLILGNYDDIDNAETITPSEYDPVNKTLKENDPIDIITTKNNECDPVRIASSDEYDPVHMTSSNECDPISMTSGDEYDPVNMISVDEFSGYDPVEYPTTVTTDEYDSADTLDLPPTMDRYYSVDNTASSGENEMYSPVMGRNGLPEGQRFDGNGNVTSRGATFNDSDYILVSDVPTNFESTTVARSLSTISVSAVVVRQDETVDNTKDYCTPDPPYYDHVDIQNLSADKNYDYPDHHVTIDSSNTNNRYIMPIQHDAFLGRNDVNDTSSSLNEHEDYERNVCHLASSHNSFPSTIEQHELPDASENHIISSEDYSNEKNNSGQENCAIDAIVKVEDYVDLDERNSAIDMVYDENNRYEDIDQENGRQYKDIDQENDMIFDQSHRYEDIDQENWTTHAINNDQHNHLTYDESPRYEDIDKENWATHAINNDQENDIIYDDVHQYEDIDQENWSTTAIDNDQENDIIYDEDHRYEDIDQENWNPHAINNDQENELIYDEGHRYQDIDQENWSTTRDDYVDLFI